jgi:hypothetical protein
MNSPNLIARAAAIAAVVIAIVAPDESWSLVAVLSLASFVWGSFAQELWRRPRG